jgi:short-subunit dehydrogenase
MTVGSIEEVDIEAICDMVRLNVESVYRMAYTVLRHFKQSGSSSTKFGGISRLYSC